MCGAPLRASGRRRGGRCAYERRKLRRWWGRVKERRAHRGAERRSFSEYHVVKSRSEPGGMAPAPSRERNEGLNGNA